MIRQLSLALILGALIGLFGGLLGAYFGSESAACDRGDLTACYLAYEHAEHRFLDRQAELVRVMKANDR